MIYLSPRIGDGSYENMYQARHAETDSKRGTIDINSTHFILNSDTPCDAIQIGDINEKLSASGKKELKKLGCEIHGETLNEVLFNILRYPTIAGLNPLTAGRGSGGFELCLGQRLWIEPHIDRKWVNTFSQWQWVKDKYVELRNEGSWHDGAWAIAMASLADTFEGSSEDPATGWTTIPSGKIVQDGSGLGTCTGHGNNNDDFHRFDTALDSDDMEVSAIFASRTANPVANRKYGGGPGARKANDTAETYYYFGNRSGTTAETELAKIVTDTFTRILSPVSHTIAADQEFYIKCDGSSISGGVDGVDHISPQTDTGISGNNYGGIYTRTAAGSYSINSMSWKSWDAVDVAAPAGGRIMSSLAHHGGLAGMGGIAGKGGGLAG